MVPSPWGAARPAADNRVSNSNSNEARVDQMRVAGALFGAAVGLALAGACAHGDDFSAIDPSTGGAGTGTPSTGATGLGGASTTGGALHTSATTGGPTTTAASTSATSSTGAPAGTTATTAATTASSTTAASSAGSTSSSGGTGGAKDGGVADASRPDGSNGNPIDAGPGTVVYSDDFEGDTLATVASGWTRVGGSNGDWAVATDATQVFAQNHATSSTQRACLASTAIATTAASIAAQVKITTLGSSGTSTAMVCIHYPAGGGTPYACLALEALVGAQIKTGGTDGPLWQTTVAVGTWYDVRLVLDATGALTAYLDDVLLGSFTPSAAASGPIAIATVSAEAEFDNVVLTTP